MNRLILIKRGPGVEVSFQPMNAVYSDRGCFWLSHM